MLMHAWLILMPAVAVYWPRRELRIVIPSSQAESYEAVQVLQHLLVSIATAFLIFT